MDAVIAHGEESSKTRRASLWLRVLRFSLVLILTILGVAYTSFSKQPIIVYWELLAPVIGLVCIGAGWWNAKKRRTRPPRLPCDSQLGQSKFSIFRSASDERHQCVWPLAHNWLGFTFRPAQSRPARGVECGNEAARS
jgi:hypothetical protein